MKNKLRILGIRGVPAAHGGFETFAHHFSLYLVEHGWDVEVFCQTTTGPKFSQDQWAGVTRSNVRVKSDSSFWSVIFDFLCIFRSLDRKTPCLILGYNTAIFSIILRLFGVPVIINMDGIEWKRAKWSRLARFWFWFNDWAGCLLGNRLIADNPGIAAHLATRGVAKKVVMIPYGAERLSSLDLTVLDSMGLKVNEFCTLIARPEPENSILEIVKAFSTKKRNCKLVVLGDYSSLAGYKKKVMDSASDEVVFVGAIYDKTVVSSLRLGSRIYFHGHTVGGTNPSLVEAMGGGNAIVAHGNIYNKWVLGSAGRYFDTVDSLAALLEEVIESQDELARMRKAALERFDSMFQLNYINEQYELMLLKSMGFSPEAIPSRLRMTEAKLSANSEQVYAS